MINLNGVNLNDPIKTSLEIGCGCTSFGKQYHPECFAVDKNEELKIVCDPCDVDHYCDAHDLPWPNNRFKKVIICNPYDFGFGDEEESVRLLNEITRVIKSEGEIIVLGHKANKFVNKLPKRVHSYNASNNDILTLNSNTLDPEKEYEGFKFTACDGRTPTKPTIKYVIEVRK